MRAVRQQEHDAAGLVGLGVRVLLLAPESETSLVRQIAGFGGSIDHETELYSALSALIDDPADWDMFIMSCDAFGGLEAGRRAFAILCDIADRVPVILLASECGRQSFPEERQLPILLRAPPSAVSLRIGMEHAVRGRLGWKLN